MLGSVRMALGSERRTEGKRGSACPHVGSRAGPHTDLVRYHKRPRVLSVRLLVTVLTAALRPPGDNPRGGLPRVGPGKKTVLLTSRDL